MAATLLHPIALSALQPERSASRPLQLAGAAALVLAVVALGLLLS
jgi:hypothetical protein